MTLACYLKVNCVQRAPKIAKLGFWKGINDTVIAGRALFGPEIREFQVGTGVIVVSYEFHSQVGIGFGFAPKHWRSCVLPLRGLQWRTVLVLTRKEVGIRFVSNGDFGAASMECIATLVNVL